MLVVSWPVDQTTADLLQAGLNKKFESRHNVIFLDFTAVDHMDDAGLAVMAAGVRALGGRGWLGLIGPNDDVRGLLESEGLLPHPNVRIFETRQAALIATGERAST